MTTECPSCHQQLEISESTDKEIFCPTCWQPLFVSKTKPTKQPRWKREKIVVKPQLADTTEFVPVLPPRPIPIRQRQRPFPVQAAIFAFLFSALITGFLLFKPQNPPQIAQNAPRSNAILELAPKVEAAEPLVMMQREDFHPIKNYPAEIDYTPGEPTKVETPEEIEVVPEEPKPEPIVEPAKPKLPKDLIEFRVVRPERDWNGTVSDNHWALKRLQSERWLEEESLPAGVLIDYGENEILGQISGMETNGRHIGPVSGTKGLKYLLIVHLDDKIRGPIQIDPDSGNWQRIPQKPKKSR